MSGSFWSGQQVEYDLILHLALFISATIIATGLGPAPPSVKATVAGPIFFSPQAIRTAILFVWFWWEREKPAAEVPPCKHKHARYAAMHVSHCSSKAAGTASEVLRGARGTPGFQDPESSGKWSRQVAVLLKETLRT